MKQFIHTPQHLKTRRILPGHAQKSRFTNEAPLPGVDRNERKARRSVWTTYRAEQRFQYGVGGSVGLVGAVLALVMTVFAAIGPNPNVLDTTTDAANVEPVELVDAAPLPSTDAASIES